jgi:alkylated DNA repair protein (DNA oxidative demethylase)
MSAATFDDVFALPSDETVSIGPSAFVLRGFALPFVPGLMRAVSEIAEQSPFRHMVTPGGATMSVAMTNCGRLGWTSDRCGYRYAEHDPTDGSAWPAMPPVFAHLARSAAGAAGFDGFEPDACLINRYVPGNRLSLHQDKDERDFSQPIVSVSLGMSAVFLFGGHSRGDRSIRVPLMHGDVAVWGREDRLRFHGVLRLEEDPHAVLGAQRVNLTFRKAG